MCKIGIFGGTTEGRQLAEYCCQNGIPAFVSVVSEYGEELLPKSPCLQVVTGAKDEARLEELLRLKQAELIIDATHPYAAEVTRNLKQACDRLGCDYVRCVREAAGCGSRGRLVEVPDLKGAVEYLKHTDGNILVTTGSKEIAEFAALSGYRDRVFLRALPSADVLEKCKALGITGRHIICMQGPFSQEMNEALIRQFQIKYLVTKEAGVSGGYEEKIDAAAACGIEALVVGRPSSEQGESLFRVKERIEKYRAEKPVKIFLVGIGMGGEGQMTRRAEQAIMESDAVIGAKRMVDSVEYLTEGKEKRHCYLPEDILKCIKENQNFRAVSVVFSGDTGFYSGTSGLINRLEEAGVDYQVIPGISSVSYFSAALGVSWEDACIASLHGREFDVEEALKGHRKLFFLMGGDHSVSWLARVLAGWGFGELYMAVGERLSYPDEKITRGTPGELKGREFSQLSIVYIEDKRGRTE